MYKSKNLKKMTIAGFRQAKINKNNMAEKGQVFLLFVCSLFVLSCNNNPKESSKKSVTNEKSFERNSELGFERFTLKFTDDENFNGIHFAVSKKVDTVASNITGKIDRNKLISFVSENENQSIEYLGRLEDKKLILYSYELDSSSSANKYTIKNKNSKLDSLEYKLIE